MLQRENNQWRDLIISSYFFFVNLLDLLNKLKWDKKYDFSKVRIWYVSRGEANDLSCVNGNEIKNIGKFLETKDGGYIPIHRIVRIEYEGKEVWKR